MSARRRSRPGRPAPDKPRGPTVLSWAVAGLLTGCFVFQCLTGMARQSATYDEPVYIAAGYSYLETGDFRLKQDAPPLVGTLSGVALRAGGYLGNQIAFDAASPLWDRSTEYQFAQRFFALAHDRYRTLQIARIPLVLIGAALAVYIFLLGRLVSPFGDDGALLPLFLFSVDPNM